MSRDNVVRKLRADLHDDIDQYFDGIQGEFLLSEVEQAIGDLLRRRDLNGYVPSIARAIARQEDAARCDIQSVNLSLFPEEVAVKAVIPLGESRRIKWADANWNHMLMKREHQEENERRVIQRGKEMNALMEMVAPIMQDDTSKTLTDAMRLLGKWK